MRSQFGQTHPTLMGAVNRRGIAPFFLAVGLALCLLTILTGVYFAGPSSAMADKQEVATTVATATNGSTVLLLAPAQAIAAGTDLSAANFRQVAWPRNQVPSGAIYDASEVQKLYARRDLRAGVPLQRDHLTSEMSHSALNLTPGNRAIAIDIDATSAVEYHIVPGSLVDVILTHQVDRELTSQLLIEKARVISLGGSVNEGDGYNAGRTATRASLPMKTASLDVSADDALRLLTARRLGQLSLMMRSVDDNNPIGKSSISGPDINKGLERSDRVIERGCNRGTIRIAGKGDYLIGCDGSWQPVLDQLEP